MPLFDTHAHYNHPPLLDNWQQAVIDAKSAGITGALIAATSAENSQIAVNMREKMPDFFYASLGAHPEAIYHDQTALLTASTSSASPNSISTTSPPPNFPPPPTPTFLQAELEQLSKLLQSLQDRPHIIDAFGEIGLDFYRLSRQPAANFAQHQKYQLLFLRQQLALFLDFSTRTQTRPPFIFHVRDDFCDLTNPHNAYSLILSEIRQAGLDAFPLIFHCFSGNHAYLAQILQFPHSYISFAGNLTFKNAPDLQKLAQAVPADRLLLETDAPFLAPVPRRGQSCAPAFLADTAAFARASLHLDLEQIYQNSRRLFPARPTPRPHS